VTWQFVLTGLLVGGLVGATGMGGGSLMTPILVLVLGFQPITAVGTDIVHGAISKTVGAVRHRRLGTVSGQLSGWMFLGSAPLSLVGVVVASHYIGSHSSPTGVAAWVLGGAFFVGGTGLLVKNLVGSSAIVRDPFVLTRRDKIAAVLIGALGGFVVGLTSVGSGVFFGLTLLIAFPLGASKVVGTDLLHAAGLLWVAGIGHLVAGNVDLHAVAWLLLGSIPGVLIGSELSVRTRDASLRVVLAVVLIVSALRLVVPSSLFWYLALAACVTIAAPAVVMRARRGSRPAQVVSRLATD
jgi:uncharacterized membrane protein YfcA